jgi:type III pantothenate kinase
MTVFILLGNTTIKMSHEPGMAEVFPVRTAKASLAAALAAHGGEVVVAACVNPPCEGILQAVCSAASLAVPLYAGRDFSAGVEMAVENPETVGVDRVLNVKAAYARARGAAIAVDFGTAVSISACDGAGRFVGGAILPGLAMALDALASGTALLPEIRPARPKSALGANTVTAMQSGTYYGTLGAAREIVARIQATFGCDNSVFVTGGDAELYSDDMPAGWVLAPGLTMEGLRLAYEESLR